MNDSVPRRASLEVLRAEASDELAVLIQERLRGGEDPWDFMEDLPSIDELVVYLLRADNIAANDGVRPSAARNYRVLRQIAFVKSARPFLGDEPQRCGKFGQAQALARLASP